MFPLRDDNPAYSTPVITIGLIVVNVLAFLFEQLIGLQLASLRYGVIPAVLLHSALPEGLSLRQQHQVEAIYALNLSPGWATIFTSMFMHGGWLHLLGNMWYLWIFGNNVEDVMGKGKYLFFYLLCGVGAALGQAFLAPDSLVPMVGASGAIAGVLGAYLYFFPRSRVLCLVPIIFVFTTMEVPAAVVLLLWFGLQLYHTLMEIGGSSGGVAVAAHVGGFVVGWLVARFLETDRRPPASPYTPRPDIMDWR